MSEVPKCSYFWTWFFQTVQAKYTIDPADLIDSSYSNMTLRRPIRIAGSCAYFYEYVLLLILTKGCSGSTTDRRSAMALLASNYENDPVDVLVGDWMSEANMTARANVKLNGIHLASEGVSDGC